MLTLSWLRKLLLGDWLRLEFWSLLEDEDLVESMWWLLLVVL
jgi:hypothetical protein